MILTEDKIYTMSLETESVNRDSGLTNNTIELEFTNKELLHAIVTCGMPIQRLTAAFPEKKRFEFLYKLFLVETALDAEGDRLKKSKKIAYLDSSEKSVISYYMGMFFTKMISRRLYGSEYLTNLNLIETPDHKEFIDFFASEWRPEMIGYRPDADAWNVWEAKGGSNYREQALKKGADQLKVKNMPVGEISPATHALPPAASLDSAARRRLYSPVLLKMPCSSSLRLFAPKLGEYKTLLPDAT